MKVIRSLDELGRTVLEARTEDYDASPPSPALIVESALPGIAEPRLALAEALVFLSSTTGPLHTEAALAPASGELLGALSRFHNVVPMNVKWKHDDIPSGQLRVLVDDYLPSSPGRAEAELSGINYQLHLPPTSLVAGSMTLLRERWVPVNASLVGSSKDQLGDVLRRFLTALLLLSTELEAATFVIPDTWTVQVTDWNKYQDLFKTVGLSLMTHSFYQEKR